MRENKQTNSNVVYVGDCHPTDASSWLPEMGSSLQN